MSKLPETLLMAYVDGELDPVRAAEVEQALQASPGLAAEVERARTLRTRLRGAHAAVLDEATPRHLLDLVEADRMARTTAAPVAMATGSRHARRGRRGRWPQFAALAASLALGVLVAPWLQRNDGAALLQVEENGVVASGALAAALDTRLSADAGQDDGVAIGMGLRTGEGGYCRTFTLSGGPATAGLACHDGGQWRIAALGQAGEATGDGLRLASSALPAAVLAAVDARLENGGEPLDAAAEQTARQHAWTGKAQ